jgi:hypothetical protein
VFVDSCSSELGPGGVAAGVNGFAKGGKSGGADACMEKGNSLAEGFGSDGGHDDVLDEAGGDWCWRCLKVAEVGGPEASSGIVLSLEDELVIFLDENIGLSEGCVLRHRAGRWRSMSLNRQVLQAFGGGLGRWRKPSWLFCIVLLWGR